MTGRFHFLVLALALGALGALAAAPLAAEPGKRADTPAKKTRTTRADPTKSLDFLFGALKAAPDASSAKEIEDRIWAQWANSSSDTTNLLMSRVKTAMAAKDNALALKLLDSVVNIKPDYAEAWNRRATLHFLMKNYTQAIMDIRQVLAREPRHFGALSGLGLILQEIGDDKRALEIYRRALDVNPHLPKVPDLIKSLSEKVEGRDI